MGRFWNKFKKGIQSVGRFVGRVADKVGSIANVLSYVPVIGGFANTVAKGANLVSKIGYGASNFIDKVNGIQQRFQPVIDKVGDAARAIYNTGIPDKLTGGAITRIIDRGRRIRDNLERRYDYIADRAGRIGQRVEQVVDTGGRIVNHFAGGRNAPNYNHNRTRDRSLPPPVLQPHSREQNRTWYLTYDRHNK